MVDKKAEYENRKKKLQEAFRAGTKDSNDVGIKKSASNVFRARKKSSTVMDVRDFTNVINVDTENLRAEVEGMITFGDLVDALLPHGVLPVVVPELMTITLGGAISGVGIEASSFKYGLVHETVLEMEVLTGAGEIVTCSREENSDLFFALPNSYGSLGYVIKATIPLVHTKPFVKLTHSKCDNAKAFFELMKEKSEKNTVDFLEGVVFNGNEFVVTTGEFSDTAPCTSDYTYMKAYFKSLQPKDEDYLTVRDFIRRWDSDWFWKSKHFGMHNPILRFLLGKWMLSSKSYLTVKNTAGKLLPASKTEAIIQDVAIPLDRSEEFLAFFNKEIQFSPLWVCPTKSPSQDRFPLFDLDPNVLYMDFGFWDFKNTNKAKGHYNRLIEDEVERLAGKKSLYSEAFYDKEEFWKIYNKDAYDAVKKKYDPEGKLKDLYQKTVTVV